jgi:arsenate reductase
LLALFGPVANLGVTLPAGSAMQSFFLEILLTAFLMFVILAVATDTRAICNQSEKETLHMSSEAKFKEKVLFLCTGNSARSIMGEALLRHYAGDHYDTYSAGLEPKGINPYTLRILAENGVDTSGLYSKDVKEYLGTVNFSHLITVCGHAEENCPTAFVGVTQHVHWDLEDPAKFEGSEEAKLAKFRETRDQLTKLIQQWLVEESVESRAKA